MGNLEENMDLLRILDVLNIFAMGFILGLVLCPIWNVIKNFFNKSNKNEDVQ